MYEGSYLWDIRRQVGSQLLLMPGAQVLVIDDDGRFLLQRSRDSGRWELPAGAAEPGDSFRTTAVRELQEETGLIVAPEDLTPLASISEADFHTLTTPTATSSSASPSASKPAAGRAPFIPTQPR